MASERIRGNGKRDHRTGSAVTSRIVGIGRGDPGASGSGGPGLVKRAVWSFLGQAVSSGSNFVLSVLVLSVASVSEFAVFALCLTTYLFVVQMTRATVGVPVTLLYSAGAGHGDHEDQRNAVGVGVAAGVVAGTLAILGSAFVSQGSAQLVMLGASLPFLLWQDMVRYVCFARGRPSAAAGADGLWLGLQVVGSAVAFATGHASATTLLGVWAAAGTVSALVMGIRLGLVPRLGAAAGWVTRQRSLCWRLLVEFMVSSGSHYGVYYGLAVVAGTDELGRLKAAQTLLGPVIVLILGGGVVGVPESVRAAHDPALVRRIAGRVSSALAAGALAWGIAIYAFLPTLGPAIFPNAWVTARPLIPMLTLFAVAFAASTGATGALRARGDSSWLLRVRMLSGGPLVVIGIVASARMKASGALLAVAVVEGVVAFMAWRRLILASGQAGTSLGSDDDGSADPDRPGRPISQPDETGADALRTGGRTPPPVVVEGVGPGSVGRPGAAPTRPGAAAAHT